MISLVQMPFADFERPSIGLGLLKAALDRGGIDAKVTYANFLFAQEVGFHASQLPLRIWPTSLVGEWVFVPAVFPGFSPPDERYLEECVAPFARFHSPGEFEGLSRGIQAELTRLRGSSSRFVDGLARKLLADRPAAVACSSMFSQQLAALALLRAVKELDPDVVTLLGGANVEGEMGATAVRTFPWVDAVCCGCADETIVPLSLLVIRRGLDGLAGPLPSGVITRASQETSPRSGDDIPRAAAPDLDALPVPDYDEYFTTLAELPDPTRDQIRPGLPMETSRGCWWGGAKGCTFCGLNRGEKTYRAKSSGRAVEEIEALVGRYGLRDVAMVDNVAPRSAFTSLLPELERRGGALNLYYETMPVLTREMVRLLAAAGVRHVQAGIEALDDDLLTLMEKGVTALQNIALLKHAREFGVAVGWHLLTGLPGEKIEWYEETARLVPLLHHLEPPASVHGVTLQRFSTYFEDPTRFGLRLVPYNSYEFVYPLGTETIRGLAYYFRDESWPEFFPEVHRGSPGQNVLSAPVMAWVEARRLPDAPRLAVSDLGEGGLLFTDTRGGAEREEVVLSGLEAGICRAAVDPVPRSTLARRLEEQGMKADPAALDEAIAEVVDLGLVLARSGSILSLATSAPEPSEARRFPGGQVSEEAFRHYLAGISGSADTIGTTGGRGGIGERRGRGRRT